MWTVSELVSKNTAFIGKYLKLSWPIFPVHSVNNNLCSCGRPNCKHPGKHPNTKNGFKDASIDAAIIDGFFKCKSDANIGIRTGDRPNGSGFFALDIDPRNGGDETFKALIDCYGPLPKTITVESGGGGQHYYFECPVGVTLNCKSNLLPGIDIKAENGYIIAPPSKHLSGGTYQWREGCSPWDTVPALAPEWLLNLITNEKKMSIESHLESSHASVDRRDECLDHLLNIRVGHNESDGSKRLFTISCRCVEYDLNDQQSLDLIRTYILQKPFPVDYSDDQIYKRISDARLAVGNCRKDGGGNYQNKTTASKIQKDIPFVPFPVEILPPCIRNFVEGCATAIGCDTTFITLPLLVGFASAIGYSRCIKLKNSWTEPAILWGAIVAESGSMKSPAIHQALRAVKNKQSKASRKYKKAKAEYDLKMKKFTKSTGELKKKYQDDPLIDSEMPELPKFERSVVDDITIESLVAVLNENPRGLLMINDELSGWFDFDRYTGGSSGVSGAASKWLEMYGGRDFIVDRKGSGNISVESAHVSLIGGIQPGILKRGLGQANKESGLAARIFMVMPPAVPKVWQDDDVDPEVEAVVASVFDYLYSLVPLEGESGRTEPQVVKLGVEAKKIFVEFHDRHNKQMSGLSSELKAVWAKLEGGAARFALVIHMVRGAIAHLEGDEAFDCTTVDEESMSVGIALSKWFGNESRRVYSMLGGDVGDRRIQKMVEAIKGKGGEISIRNWERRHSNMTSAVAEMQLNELVSCGLGFWKNPKKTKGRPKTKLLVLKCAEEAGELIP